MLALSAVSGYVLLQMIDRLPESVPAGTDPLPAIYLAGSTTLMLLFGSLVAQLRR
jgi:hypothetical protein